jgi:hypothetical protein
MRGILKLHAIDLSCHHNLCSADASTLINPQPIFLFLGKLNKVHRIPDKAKVICRRSDGQQRLSNEQKLLLAECDCCSLTSKIQK